MKNPKEANGFVNLRSFSLPVLTFIFRSGILKE